MSKSTFLAVAFALILSAVVSKECIPSGVKRKEPECFYGRERVACIGAPNVSTITPEQVSPTSFVASWTPIEGAVCYHVRIVIGYTNFIQQIIPCHSGNELEARNLESNSVYGIIVRAVDEFCNRGPPGIPARVRTVWIPTTKPKTTAGTTETPEPMECGKGFFTCHSSRKECVRNDLWCNRKLDCDDKSDERGCPGGCEELDLDFKRGNYSCSRWGSPGSVCTFDCDPGYQIDGFKRIQCKRKTRKWNRSAPVCRLPATRSLRVLNVKSTTSQITVQWTPIKSAFEYIFLVIEKPAVKGDRDPLTKIKSVHFKKCCETIITGLIPNTEFIITMRAIDSEGYDGKESRSALGRTAKVKAID